MLLSILTPAIWSRLQQSSDLEEEIRTQIALLDAPPVEHLVMLDNKTRTVGLKRQALLDSALGDYIAFVDDDDLISDDYVEQILAVIKTSRPDVITFRQRAEINGKVGHIDFRADATEDLPWAEGQTVIRPPWHVCAWRRELVKDCIFPDINDGEDRLWCLQARPKIRTHVHLNAVLHTYRFDEKTTAATGR